MSFQVRSWPTVVLHIDGDAFFVSVLQAINPSLKGKAIVAGSERGIATAVSYEAKKYGVKRAMRISEVRKLCPHCIVMNSDYETYSLFSKRMFDIMREFSPTVEEYSIDEAFADLKGLRRPLKMTYQEIAAAMKNKVESSLGISVSVGVSLTKSLAKLASSFLKPSGLKLVDGISIDEFLQKIPVEKVWGIGENTASYCYKLGIRTAYELTIKEEIYIQKYFSKPIFEIWKELRGQQVYAIDITSRTTYKSIQRTGTFRPATNDPKLLWPRLMEHIEDAFSTARKYNYYVGKISIFLKGQDFRYYSTEIKLSEKTIYPMLIINEIKNGMRKIWKKGVLYRASGCTISDLSDLDDGKQPTLFADTKRERVAQKIYPLLESNKVNFASSLYDKDRLVQKKHKPKTSIPFITLDP